MTLVKDLRRHTLLHLLASGGELDLLALGKAVGVVPGCAHAGGEGIERVPSVHVLFAEIDLTLPRIRDRLRVLSNGRQIREGETEKKANASRETLASHGVTLAQNKNQWVACLERH